MIDIILSFFAVLGIGLLGALLFDTLYFKKRIFELPMLIDLRNTKADEAWNIFEAVFMARKYPGGKAVISELIVLVSPSGSFTSIDTALQYLRVFDLPGSVFTGLNEWIPSLQNTPKNDGTKLS